MQLINRPALIRNIFIVKMFVLIALFSTSANAEYYFSYSMPETCQTCYYPSMQKTTNHRSTHTAKKIYKKPNAKLHRKIYHSHHCETYQPGNSGWVPGYWINGYWVRGSYYSYQDAHHHAARSHRASRYHSHRNDDYNPDMATGDDDTWINPGMNIDY